MIYTAITGGYDPERIDIKVFAEYNKFKDNRLNAKIYKCLPNLFMPDSDWWLWIDGNLTLKEGAVKELIEMAGEEEVCVFEHPDRDTIDEEIAEIKRLKLDNPESIDSMILNKDGKLPACYLILRRNTEEVRRANERWWALICSGSVRDQISFTTAYPKIKYFPREDPLDNKYFRRVKHKI